MAFLQLWFTAYLHPVRFVEGLRGAPAPLWGFYATLVRAAIDSLLIYLPLFLIGRQPPMPSYLPMFPTETYYGALVVIGPIVFLTYWLFASALTHVVLRFVRRATDIDLLLNLGGFTALIVGTFIAAWDWLWIVGGWGDQSSLGISHLVIDLWGIALSVVALKRLLGVPPGLSLAINLLVLVAWLPFGMLVMRSPL